MTFADEGKKLLADVKAGTITEKQFVEGLEALVDKDRDALTVEEKAAKYDEIVAEVKGYFPPADEAELDGGFISIDSDASHLIWERVTEKVLGDDCWKVLNIFEEG